MKKRLLAVMLVAVMAVSLLFPVVASAADPTVTITVSAVVVSITNTQDTWAIGPVLVDAVVYFSADGNADVDYSQIENTGNVAVDVEIQGTDAEGGAYDWTLAAAAGDKAYSLYANSEGAPTVYDVEVKSSSYVDLTTDLAALGTYDWSMKFTAPTDFDAADAGANKTATVTLVASQH
jgi:hypothetical protein